jgi:hypothetical protein
MTYRKLLCVLVVMTAAGCTSEHEPAAQPGTPPAASPSPSPSASAAPAGRLALPAGAEVLVAENDGKGSGKLPGFTSKGTYTVLLTCEGGGKVHLSPNGGTGDETPCDGVPWVYRVFKPEGEQHIALTAGDSSSWSAAVLAGAPKPG